MAAGDDLYEAISFSDSLKNRIKELAVGWNYNVETDEWPHNDQDWRHNYRIRSSLWKEEERLHCLPVCCQKSVWDDRYRVPGYWFNQEWIEETPKERSWRVWNEKTEREKHFSERLAERESLPIASCKQALLNAVASSKVTLIVAETGSGKSTQVPQYLLDDAIDKDNADSCHIIVTQPRRIAAVSLAARVNWERGRDDREKYGPVGHIVRFDENPPRPWGSIAFCTDGSLLPRIRKLGASHVIVDEVHTRSVHTDLLLAVLKVMLRESPDLKILVMSATFDINALQEYFAEFGTVPIVRAKGRLYDVKPLFLEDIIETLKWRPDNSTHRRQDFPRGAWSEDLNEQFEDEQGAYSPSTVETVRSLKENIIALDLIVAVLKWVAGWHDHDGAVLVFLPGWAEINSCANVLKRDPDPTLRQYDIITLHSTAPTEQKRAFVPSRKGVRKAILSTDIAETSVTIPDVICVVDAGLAKIKSGRSLDVSWVSQANVIQRRGRAGRVREGTAVHLFTRKRFENFRLDPEPEIRRVPLPDVVLTVCDLGLDLPEEEEEDEEALTLDARRVTNRSIGDKDGRYVWQFLKETLNPPESGYVKNAVSELKHVGALDYRGYITHLGVLLARFPLTPTLGAAVFLGGLLGIPTLAAHVAATLQGREIWSRAKPTNTTSTCDDDPEWTTTMEAGSEEAAVAKFALNSKEEDMFSDVFAVANALREFIKTEKEGGKVEGQTFCSRHSLIYSAMQQMANVKDQLKKALEDFSLKDMSDADSDTFDPLEGKHQVGDKAEDCNLEANWELLQLLLVFHGNWNVATHKGGRQVGIGFVKKKGRLPRTSAIAVAMKDPPSNLLTYADFATFGGDKAFLRLLSSVTMVTPQQLLLFGGRKFPALEGYRKMKLPKKQAVIDGWCRVNVDEDTWNAICMLRVVTQNVMQFAAQKCEEQRRWKGDESENDWAFSNDVDWIQEWRSVCQEIAKLPIPPYAPYHVEPWLPCNPSEMVHVIPLQKPIPPPTVSVELEELPIGWGEHEHDIGDGTRKSFYNCPATNNSTWDRPVNRGPDGSAKHWRWKMTEGRDGPEKRYYMAAYPSGERSLAPKWTHPPSRMGCHVGSLSETALLLQTV